MSYGTRETEVGFPKKTEKGIVKTGRSQGVALESLPKNQNTAHRLSHMGLSNPTPKGQDTGRLGGPQYYIDNGARTGERLTQKKKILQNRGSL